jgi:hypothetical protein
MDVLLRLVAANNPDDTPPNLLLAPGHGGVDNAKCNAPVAGQVSILLMVLDAYPRHSHP